MTKILLVRSHRRLTYLAASGLLRPCRSKAQHPRHEADLINRSQGLRPPDSPTGSFDRKVASFADAKVRDAQGNERARDGEASSQLEPSASDASQETPADFGTSKLHLAQWYLAETGKPTFLAVEAVLAVAFLGLLDGGLSGVHSRAFSTRCPFPEAYFPLFVHTTVKFTASVNLT
jgi:hypothetical protein